MKYIRFESAGIVLFRDGLSHKQLASHFPLDTPISAGFVRYNGENLVCHGDSMTLELKSNEDDTKALNSMCGVY